MKTKIYFFILLFVLCGLASCGSSDRMGTAPVTGHYTYQHGWHYDILEGHVEVTESGTMDFNADGTALDSACQVYTVALAEGDTVVITYNYISPSLWRLEGNDFYFRGVDSLFSMETVDIRGNASVADELSRRFVSSVSGSIGRETKFVLADLSSDRLVWSYRYADGHCDTWLFER